MTIMLIGVNGYTVDGIHYTEDGDVAHTERGPYCGECNRYAYRMGMAKRRHADARSVAMCYAIAKSREEDARAEYDAEMATERHYENRGYWETRAQEDYERACGVLDPDYWN